MILGTITALSQLFFEPFPIEIEEARQEHRKSRSLRDENRIASFALLEEINTTVDLPESLLQKSKDLILRHDENQKESLEKFEALNKIKASHKIKGFKHLNSFLDAIGMPILVLVIAIIFFLLYKYRKSINFQELSKSFFYISLLCLFSSSVYLIWAFSPKKEIDKVFYVAGLVCASIASVFFLVKFLKFIFINNREEKLQKALNVISKFAFIDVEKYLKEDQETKNKYEEDVVKTLNDGMLK